MATRRSARLRGQTPAIEPIDMGIKRSPSKRLAEICEDPSAETKKLLESVPSTPKTNPSKTMLTPVPSSTTKNKITPKTPDNHGAIKPSVEEMHPSKAQQSTTKKPDSGLQLGFRPIHDNSKSSNQPVPSVINTPSKKRVSNADELSKMSFDFKFSCGESQLSQEAKKLMESLREEAARIKSQMVIEQNAQKRKDEEAEAQPTARKIAKPKGIAGRFSSAHMAQFRKMDSIEGHPSAFRARVEPSQTSPVKDLKRKSSKAQLGDPEKYVPTKTRITPASRATSTGPSIPQRGGQASATQSTRTPLSGDSSHVQNKPPLNLAPLDKSKFTTPQKPTIARATSVKYPHTVKAQSISRSPTRRSLFAAPKTPQTDVKYKSNMPKLKSILRRPQPLFSSDPEKIAAGTHQPLPRADFDTKLLGLSDSFKPSMTISSSKKTVDFSASTKLRDACNDASPSAVASKSQTSGSRDVLYPTLPPTTPPHERRVPGFTFKFQSPAAQENVSPLRASKLQPVLERAPIPHGITNKKRRREDTDEEPQTPQNDRFIKRLKQNPTTPPVMQTPSPVKRRLPATVTPKRSTPIGKVQKGKGLTLSRLNFLATPKVRH
ncbi:hypothetical protein MGYG_01036 [Nannizzia gypsea CBS 118893]|uniref:Erythromycin esterase n=1 Tax=Arthroderma gypseum (strain ATCC MYA-4604 / CBS 118893) TaxID=535722 RepID=E5R3U0_ARTGP|nr:hypothetical protein MGYG_01036 [Nannizzia gypsea CBS 118893]EFQ98000.1 hypothetical protein MGYG_01036 [Nannizzia gypsea CBS 118893]